ncbi:Alpha/Beta hydrolase protein [Mycena rosella]|uniref:acylaminoacyl-peptidase n=1 Tax=Mycena rosella TaxID=1033263 RepID=A0AAD7DBQ3_MYCRO|nr:Alpha/Beta hydrolase protein [Mycena rosella]
MSLYQPLSEIPLPTAAQFTTEDVDLGDVVASTSAPVDSVCFPRRAVLRETAEKKRYVEMWIGNVLEVSEDVSNAHESFYSDEFFSALSFSPSELAFLYVAEAKEATDSGEKFKFTPHIGEGLASKKRPTVFIFRWDTAIIPSRTTLVMIAPDQAHIILFGQPVFSPLDSRTIYTTGYEYTRDGRLLGLRWCYNRPSGIWEIKLASAMDKPDDGAPISLICLFWLSCASGGPHGGTFSLHVYDPTAQELTSIVLVDTIWEPRASDGFPGLYINSNLPASPFVTLGNQLFFVFDSAWGARTTVLLVSASDGMVKNLTPDSDGKLYSWSVLATDGRSRVICSRSAPSILQEIVLGSLDMTGGVSWHVIHSPYISPHLKTALSSLASSVIAIPDCGQTQTVVIRPSNPDSTPPYIQFIHGGPHGAITTAFTPSTVALALEGSFLRALLGNCGTLDVQDCLATVRHLISLGLAVEGKNKQFVMGGSHWEFLAAHLIGHIPDIFTAAVIRNPVISTDPLSSDIPDWTAPLAYVDAVTAHVLLHLGGADLRVTPTHGLEYYHALKGNARNRRPAQDVEMHWFEKENHSLDGVEAARVVWETSRDWFARYRA